MKQRVHDPLINGKFYSFLWMGFGGFIGFITIYFLFTWCNLTSFVESTDTSIFLPIHKELNHNKMGEEPLRAPGNQKERDALEISEYPAEMSEYPASQIPVPVSQTHVKSLENGGDAAKIFLPPFIKNGVRGSKGTKPKIALVITGLGPNADILKGVLERLPKQITLSFASYTPHLTEWIKIARIKGHEVLMDLPLESAEYPQLNSGPYTLRVDANPSENINKLNKILGKGGGMIVGVCGVMGSRFLASFKDTLPFLEALKTEGYMFLDTDLSSSSVVSRIGEQLSLPFVQNSQFLDNELSPSLIQKNLMNLERIAEENGFAVGVGHAYGPTVEFVMTWAEALGEKGFDLVPITDVLQ